MSRRGSPRKEHARKQSAFSWEIEGSDYKRTIQFKALKDDEKIGFGLGGKDQRTQVVCVRTNTQAYWKGIKVGYTVTLVNGEEVNKITVTSSIREACVSGKDFSITMLVPNKPDWPDNGEGGDDTEPTAPTGADDDKSAKKDQPDAPVVEYAFSPKSADDKKESADGNPDDTESNNYYRSKRSKSRTLLAATVTQAQAAEPQKANAIDTDATQPLKSTNPLKDEDIAKASKEELEAMEKAKKAEIAALEDAQTDLTALIKQKEAELAESHERAVLEELKRLRKRARELRDALRRALEELERIRAMLRKRLEELEKGMKGLGVASDARKNKLDELEALVQGLQKSAGAGS